MCTRLFHEVHGGCGKLSEQQIDVVTGKSGCNWLCASCPPPVIKKSYEENGNISRQQLKILEFKISTIESSLEEIGKVLSSAVSYAEEVKNSSLFIDMNFQHPRYPPIGRSSFMGK